jgi:hypothetical protein
VLQVQEVRCLVLVLVQSVLVPLVLVPVRVPVRVAEQLQLHWH